MENHDVTNLSYLKDLTNNNPQLWKKYVRLFVENMPDEMDALNDLLAQQNWAVLRKRVHALKPQLLYMGMKNVKQMVEELEKEITPQPAIDRINEKLLAICRVTMTAVAELKVQLN